MEIHTIEDPNQIREIITVVRSAWGMNSMDSLVKDIVTAMRYHGGLVLGAYEDGKMIGMQYSFPGYRKGKTYLYSHMTGIITEKKYAGIGYQLKTKQKEWAIENGFDMVAWTFDPLMSLNANFNIHKLGTIARTYLYNFYGMMEDPINNGLPTDRFVTEWWVKKEKNLKYHDLEFINEVEDFNGILKCGNISEPESDDIAFRFPTEFLKVKMENKEIAKDWRERSKNMFKHLFSKGYVVVDFNKTDGYYVLQKDPEFLGDERERIFS